MLYLGERERRRFPFFGPDDDATRQCTMPPFLYCHKNRENNNWRDEMRACAVTGEETLSGHVVYCPQGSFIIISK